MHLPLLLKGMVIGFSIAAPIGPVGILCIRRSLKRGRLSGFITGMGTATVDGIYAAIAVFGVSLLGSFLLEYREVLQSFAIVFLAFLGYKILHEKRPTGDMQRIGRKGLLSDFLSTFVITMSNPMTIFALAAIFTGINISREVASPISCILLVIGVFLGSTLWRAILSHAVCYIGKRTNRDILRLVNTISGICLLIFALALFVNLLLS